ncbi:MAG: hypothetical protein ACTHJ8_02785 [Mucilaginibacter sp.]
MASMPLVSCLTKSDDPVPIITNSSWTFNGTKYTPESVKRNDYVLLASKGDVALGGSMISFVFKTYPKTNGTYKMVGFNVNGGQPANDNEVTVGAMGDVNGGPFYSSPSANANANVTVTNGKVHIVVPEVWATNIDKTDSVKISADVIEQ